MKKADKKIYLDYAATAPIDPRVIRAMMPYLTKHFGNSESLHHFGRETKKALEDNRNIIAKSLYVEPREIIFTSSATESNNLAIKGVAFANKHRGRHIIISAVEHDCILNSAYWLKKQGFKIEKLPVDKYGLVDPKDLTQAIKKDTILVSVMHANNEIGTIQPIDKIGQICRKRGIYFHTDAAQTMGKIPINIRNMNIDLLTASSHKMYGPKGAAFLYIRQGTNIASWLHGGGHEIGIRSSTSNVAAIVGFAKALEICQQEMDKETIRLINLRDKLIKGVLKDVPDSILNGHPKIRLPNNINFSFAFVEGEAVATELDFAGIAVSTGSACASAKLEPSHVLRACGIKPELVHGSIRVSLGRWTKKQDIDCLIHILPKIIYRLRKVSPFKDSVKTCV